MLILPALNSQYLFCILCPVRFHRKTRCFLGFYHNDDTNCVALASWVLHGRTGKVCCRLSVLTRATPDYMASCMSGMKAGPSQFTGIMHSILYVLVVLHVL